MRVYFLLFFHVYHNLKHVLCFVRSHVSFIPTFKPNIIPFCAVALEMGVVFMYYSCHNFRKFAPIHDFHISCQQDFSFAGSSLNCSVTHAMHFKMSLNAY